MNSLQICIPLDVLLFLYSLTFCCQS